MGRRKKNFEVATAPQANEHPDAAAIALFLGTFAVACFCLFQSLGKPLLGPHAFRQTQTAISSYYGALESAAPWENILPVLGKPWNLPVEFPFFQFVVGRLWLLFGGDLDFLGRLCSSLMWLGCIVPLYWIFQKLGLSRTLALYGISIFLSVPLYLFWSATFLIESTAIFLVLVYFLSALNIFRPDQNANRYQLFFWLLLALFSGVAAALQKATTWSLAAGVIFLFTAAEVFFFKKKPKPFVYLSVLTITIIPFVLAKLWIGYGDKLKKENPFAAELFVVESPNHFRWNFGTYEQRIDPATWYGMWHHVVDQILGNPQFLPLLLFVALLAMCVMFDRQNFFNGFLLICGFFAGPLVFLNLYHEHSYYWCANAIWLIMALVVWLAGASKGFKSSQGQKIFTGFFALAFVGTGFLGWANFFNPILKQIPEKKLLLESWTSLVDSTIPMKRTILIIGNDWNPVSLYYAKRKGIAFPTADWIHLPGPQLDSSLSRLVDEERIGAVLVNPALFSSENQAFFPEFFAKLGISQNGKQTPFGIFFLALDLEKTKQDATDKSVIPNPR
jgi:hypothetical protein